MEEVGLLQATLDAIGEADNEIGGFRQTRVVAFTEKAEATPATYEWLVGSLISYFRNPTEMLTLPWIRLDSDGRVFKVTGVTALGGGYYEVEVDLRGETAPSSVYREVFGTINFLSGSSVYFSQPENVAVGGWIKVLGTGNWFQIVALDGNVATIANPFGLTVPSGVQSPVNYSPTPNVSIINNTIEVESVLNWPDAGSVAIGEILYQYTSKSLSPMQLEGLTYFDGGEDVVGLKRDHSIGDVVTDVTREYSALEQTRNAMLVDYANGEDLNVVGRNIGVLRYPFLASDDAFREIIKALGYNPRGTIFGLELALDAMAGEGNYEIYEDLVNYPCTVFVRLTAAASLEERAIGRAILTGPEVVVPTSPISLGISGTVINRGTAYSVRLKDHIHDGDFRNAKPSALEIEDIPGSPVAAWAYQGSSGATEAANVILTPGEGIRISHTASGISRYSNNRRLAKQYSDWSIDCVMRIPSTATLLTSFSSVAQWTVQILDGSRYLGWGCYQNAGNPNFYSIALVTRNTLVGASISLAKDVWYAVQIKKRGDAIELWIDGNFVDQRPYLDFTTATVNYKIQFGIDNGTAPTTLVGDLSQLSHNVHSPGYDYWNLYHENATMVAPNQIQVSDSKFRTQDPGKRIETYNSTATNPYGGNNNGKFEIISFIDNNNVDVRGPLEVDAADLVGSTEPLRIVVDSRRQQFIFPDDLGKQIVLSNSAQGNDGTYTIEKLLDPDTLDDLAADFDTPLRTVTNICEIEEPSPLFSFVAETGLDFRINPVFVSESGVDFTLSGAASESSGIITLRTPLPTVDFLCDVWYSEVLSALVLLDFSIQNTIVQFLPEVLWQYYPFYLSDPLGFIRAYLDDITAAGVIPEYSLE